MAGCRKLEIKVRAVASNKSDMQDFFICSCADVVTYFEVVFVMISKTKLGSLSCVRIPLRSFLHLGSSLHYCDVLVFMILII